ncbi:structural maintenance of chromosomes protein 5 [Engraulis encrasicolus]|uniref:structural maintenance of chromosomes protein 5 n=1 Tax=Engraulis encrasicolus TaxID=184585 RepID=UPI002FD22DC0
MSVKRKRISHAPQEIPSTSQGETFAGGDAVHEFVEGSIYRIRMQNFLTYDLAEVFPGPNLNMIIGANGTGKSSIVCAICLGLAGKTTILGRGDKVGLYVKRGCAKGMVEIELFRTGVNLVVQREIHVDSNQSVWQLNGRPASLKQVEEEVRALHIQVANLCQFLPQEKVGEFAKMSKIELLEATEKSVGPPEMYNFHCDLKSFRNKERDLENVCKEKASFLKKAMQRNERNKHDVERYQKKKRHLELIQLLEKKKPWVEYEMARKELEQVKKDREEAKKSLKELKDQRAPMLRKIQSIDQRLTPIHDQIKEMAANIREATQKCKQKQDQLDNKNRQIEDIKQSVSLKQAEEADRQKRMGNTRHLISDLQAQLQQCGDHGDLGPRLDELHSQLRANQEERGRLEGERADLRRQRDRDVAELRMLQNRMRGLEDMMNRKEEKLRSRFNDTHKALLWLRQNKELFQGKAYEPMMLEIRVRDTRNSKYIESHIPVNDLRAFVFQKAEDMEKFMSEVRDKQGLRVNAVIAPQESHATKPPSRPLESLRRFGLFSYLRELFEAPEEIMSYLCYQYRVNEVPVGTQQTKNMIETVIRESQLRMIYTADEKYTVKKSSYSNNVISSNSALRPPQFLTVTIDAEERRQLQDQIRAVEARVSEIDAQVAALQERQGRLDHRDNELRAQKKELSDLKGKRRQLEQKISTKQDSLRQMESSVVDLQRVERDSQQKISTVHNQKVAIVQEFMQYMKRRATLSREKVCLSLETVALTAEKNKLESDCRDGTAELRALEQACTDLDRRKTTLLSQCKSLMRRASEICNMGPDDAAVPQELHDVFSMLPDTLEDIEARLSEERTRAELFTGISETVVEEYNRREQEIKNLEKELEEKKNALDTYRQNISEVKERWLNPLRQLVEQINERFSDFFRSMQCAGEVDLHTENEEEYDKYGIRIRVKFRNSTQLHELTPHHQSGGERSVSTMLYLMALQELNRCPFRVVDEINQGMDPVNERRVFDIVVRTACKGTTSQYFFITPKLLQNLQYAEDMSVLCVHNGPHMLPPRDWSSQAFQRRRARQSK